MLLKLIAAMIGQPRSRSVCRYCRIRPFVGAGRSWKRSTNVLLSPAHLSELCDQAGALVLFGYCVPQRIWCSTHKSENPADVIDSNLSLRPLEVQPSLRGANECLSFSVTHEPVPPLPMPTRSGTYLTPETNEHRVPGESNSWHSQGPVRQSQAPRPRSILD